jgi:hypothetical protein
MKYIEIDAGNGKRNKTCGCKLIDHSKIKHIRLHQCWNNMRTRCNNPNYYKFHRYGGRGITICKEWDDFCIFQEWALHNGYMDHLQIDRIDNNSGYEPANCRWVTGVENTRNNSNVKINKGIAEKIRAIKRSKGLSDLKISKMFGIRGRQVNNIVNNKHWG